MTGHHRLVTRRSGLLLGLGIAASRRSDPASAEDGVRVLRLYSDGAASSPYGVGARALAAEAARRTGGRLHIDLMLGSSAVSQTLGPQRAQGRGMVEAVRSGDADIAIVSAATLGDLVPDLLVLDLPFLFDGPAEARAALDGPVGQRLLALLPAQGLIGLGWGEGGMRHITTTARPVREPADLAGLSIRVQENPVHRETFEALGARAVSMPALIEVVAALREGRLDGQDNLLWVLPRTRMEEVQRHASLTGHFYQTTAFLLSSAAEARLSIEERSALAEATRAGVAANRAAVEQEDAAALVRLRQAGMEVEERPDRAAFRATLAPLTTRWRSRFNSVLIGGLAPVR